MKLAVEVYCIFLYNAGIKADGWTVVSAWACYASIISTIEIQLSLSPHQTAMPRHEVWASDN